ncbi:MULTISPECIES: N-acetylmuramoyl-L-alanine amidase [unclassified Sphingomonas]|uniref:N-acetylmuramoyl-L-alanine amidase n=1 Tax=unclassified Sphingomonas TaxID=196159 RepID=UPI0006F9480C|nr:MULTISPECIES: N-acetylmuramoyl-L-alanine amidase [unclassified Sphingomonas]KQM65468.1 N-acetylmuramoyl-L-alanine amidase [Sphingomonas sp. Leaf16]KQN17072.1 N-acetylmuramoyl-L-alanine amidase [Sphingomonas sp. Leaf32]KQN17243.1 N-acetylmuramoyl-L-alanine amidase [Sphingomonas sp. Leaf29]
MGAWLAFLSIWFGVPVTAQTIDAVDVGSDRITIRLDSPANSASSFVLGGPDRLVVDLDGVRPGGRSESGGAVRAVRQGARDRGSRIVFDLDRPLVVTAGRFSDDGRRLTLTLSGVAPERYARATTAGRMRFQPQVAMAAIVPASSSAAMIVDARQRATASVPVPSRRRGQRLPRIEGDADRPLVVIDAGHGGHDPGAISPHGGMQEKDLTLKTARAVRDALLASGRVRVALTRDRDEFLVLQERYAIARRLGASLFISIHCDSADNPQATGASIYTLSEVASDREAARLAARENKADILAGVDLGRQSADISSILIDLTQRETMNASAGFARLLGREATGVIPLKPNYHRMASLMVLKAPDLPSILFETGYLSNEADAQRLDSAEGRRAIAKSVERAVEVYFARRMAAR